MKNCSMIWKSSTIGRGLEARGRWHGPSTIPWGIPPQRRSSKQGAARCIPSPGTRIPQGPTRSCRLLHEPCHATRIPTAKPTARPSSWSSLFLCCAGSCACVSVHPPDPKARKPVASGSFPCAYMWGFCVRVMWISVQAHRIASLWLRFGY